MPKCNSDQVINPKTGRCRKISELAKLYNSGSLDSEDFTNMRDLNKVRKEYDNMFTSKSCMKGKILNPKTKRCKKIEDVIDMYQRGELKNTKMTSSEEEEIKDYIRSVKSDCDFGKVKNPDTGRCMDINKVRKNFSNSKIDRYINKSSDSVSKSMKKATKNIPTVEKVCKDGQMINPKTKRCKKIEDVIDMYQEGELKNTKLTSNEEKQILDYIRSIKSDCDYGKVKNPDTGRCMNIDNVRRKFSDNDIDKYIGMSKYYDSSASSSDYSASSSDYSDSSDSSSSSRTVSSPKYPECKDGKVRNPKTKNCNDIDRIYKFIMSNDINIDDIENEVELDRMKKFIKSKECKSGYIKNPKTGKCVPSKLPSSSVSDVNREKDITANLFNRIYNNPQAKEDNAYERLKNTQSQYPKIINFQDINYEKNSPKNPIYNSNEIVTNPTESTYKQKMGNERLGPLDLDEYSSDDETITTLEENEYDEEERDEDDDLSFNLDDEELVNRMLYEKKRS